MTKPDPFATDDDNPALSDDRLASMKPAAQVFTPEQLAALSAGRKVGRPLKPDRRVSIKLRIDPKVLEAYKAAGPGWQTRMHDALRRSIDVDTKA